MPPPRSRLGFARNHLPLSWSRLLNSRRTLPFAWTRAVSRSPPVTRTVSAWKARLAGRLLEWAYRVFRLPGEPPMTRFVAEQMSTSHWYDLSAARRDLGYEPRVTIEEGLRRLGEKLRGG